MKRIGISYHGGEADYDAYERAIRAATEKAGTAADVVWLAGRDRPFLMHALLGLDGIVFTGGEDVGSAPERDLVERALMEHALRKDLPILAICRGAQMLNVFHGGTLIQDLGARNATHRAPPEKQHAVQIEPESLLAGIYGAESAIVNSSHHQAVDRIAEGFRVTATAPDGVIEAFERQKRCGAPFVLAVQWHPELMSDDASSRLFHAFLAAVSPP